MDEFFSPTKASIDRSLLEYAAGTAIFCLFCSAVADCKRWVVASIGERTVSCCATCWDSKTRGATLPPFLDLVDGRVVFARKRKAA